jgi:hypothetical protein
LATVTTIMRKGARVCNCQKCGYCEVCRTLAKVCRGQKTSFGKRGRLLYFYENRCTIKFWYSRRGPFRRNIASCVIG